MQNPELHVTGTRERRGRNARTGHTHTHIMYTAHHSAVDSTQPGTMAIGHMSE